jgi:hypothetical protein
MAKKKRMKRRRTTSEKVIIVLGIIIALSMILSLVVGLGGRSTGDAGSSNLLPETSGQPVAMSTGDSSGLHIVPWPDGIAGATHNLE